MLSESLFFPKASIIWGFSPYVKERTSILEVRALLFILSAVPSCIHPYTSYTDVFVCSQSPASTGSQTSPLASHFAVNQEGKYRPCLSSVERSTAAHKCFQQNPLLLNPAQSFFLSLSLYLIYIHLHQARQVLCHLLTVFSQQKGIEPFSPPRRSLQSRSRPSLPPQQETALGDLKLLIFRPSLTNCLD